MKYLDAASMVQFNVSTEDGAELTGDGVDVSAILINPFVFS